MNLTPAERAALDGMTTTRTVHTVISGFEAGPEAVFLLIPVPAGPGYAIGDRITITFEDPS